MTKIYFYPKVALKPRDVQNSYVNDFENAISMHNKIINENENAKGVLDFFKYLSRVDIYLFNWVEDIPRRRFGKLQVLFFIIFLALRKLFRNKIIWVLHNKYSHNLKRNRWTDFMFKLMMKNADLILTHSSEGIEFVKKNYPKNVHKVKYEIHPIKEKLKYGGKEKIFDFMFWGTIHPYKNIIKFLQFISTDENIGSPKILIVGRCFDEDYKNQLTSYLSDDVLFENKFYELEDIGNLAIQSKFILFTYSSESVLSSGALMDSIRMNSDIIGPNYGAFKDLNYLPNIHVYDNYEDIISIFKTVVGQKTSATDQQLESFFEENNWTMFANKFQRHVKELFLSK